MTRLGGGYTEWGGITEESAERTLRALEEFRAVIDKQGGVKEIFPVATSVVRRAANGERFTAEVRKRTGFDVSVVSGIEEARLSLLGVLSVIEGDGPALVVDIGGGSTEFIAAATGEVAGAWSMEMGVVHLTEDHINSDPPLAEELRGMEGEIEAVIESLKGAMREEGDGGEGGTTLIGTAGTITTLAAIDMALDSYDREKINNYILTRTAVEKIYRELSAMTMKERGEVLSLEKGREDLIVPGAAIVLRTMDSFGFESMRVSDAGLLEGVIIDRAGH
ncbi:MAG: exopolyphosphatase [Thermodesulfobacteriota bacterium]